MSDLRNALHKTGLVSERKFRELEAAEQLDAEAREAACRKRENEVEKRMQILHESTSPDSFRREARKLLLQNPGLVQQIINIAHERGMKQKKDKGGGRLIANLLQLRDTLSKGGMSDKDKTALVDKSFSKR